MPRDADNTIATFEDTNRVEKEGNVCPASDSALTANKRVRFSSSSAAASHRKSLRLATKQNARKGIIEICAGTVALAATHWLLEESRRSDLSAPKSTARAAECFIDVTEQLKSHKPYENINDVRRALVASQPGRCVKRAWCDSWSGSVSLGKARDDALVNYQAWDPIIHANEWNKEQYSLTCVRNALSQTIREACPNKQDSLLMVAIDLVDAAHDILEF